MCEVGFFKEAIQKLKTNEDVKMFIEHLLNWTSAADFLKLYLALAWVKYSLLPTLKHAVARW